MFDVGVAGHLTKRNIWEQRGPEFGKAFEHFMLMEIIAFRSYTRKDFVINFWRTKTGIEVDFVLGDGEVTIEIKGASRVDKRDMNGLEAFIQTCHPKKAIVACNEKEKRAHGKIMILPWGVFLQELWSGRII
jgi:predicted AAA+ superfamily ATPase